MESGCRDGQKTVALEKAMAEIKALRGILPICSYCKKIGMIKDTGESLRPTFRITQKPNLVTAYARSAQKNIILIWAFMTIELTQR